MLIDEIRPGTGIEIRQVDVAAGDDKGSAGEIYISKVYGVNPDDTIDIAVPQFMDKTVDLIRNTRYSFLFVRQVSMKAAQGVFLQRIRIDNVPMARIKLVTQVRKIQRRDYYRLGCNINLLFQIVRLRPNQLEDARIIEDVEADLSDDNWLEGTIVDISGGGMKFTSQAPIMDLPYGFFNFFLELDGRAKHVKNIGKILDRQPIPRSLDCTYRVKFVPEHTKAQDEILAYIASRQRKIAKKETGL